MHEFTRTGLTIDDYQRGSEKISVGKVGFIPPSSHRGSPILRFAIVNPQTNISDIELMLARLVNPTLRSNSVLRLDTCLR